MKNSDYLILYLTFYCFEINKEIEDKDDKTDCNGHDEEPTKKVS